MTRRLLAQGGFCSQVFWRENLQQLTLSSRRPVRQKKQRIWQHWAHLIYNPPLLLPESCLTILRLSSTICEMGLAMPYLRALSSRLRTNAGEGLSTCLTLFSFLPLCLVTSMPRIWRSMGWIPHKKCGAPGRPQVWSLFTHGVYRHPECQHGSISKTGPI